MKKLLLAATLGVALVGCSQTDEGDINEVDVNEPEVEDVEIQEEAQMDVNVEIGASGSTDTQLSDIDLDNIELTSTAEQQEGDFKVTVTSEKEVYKEGEPIKVNSVFSYLGEEDVNIEHGSKIVTYAISQLDGDIQLFDIITMDLRYSTIKNGEEIEYPLVQQGVYNPDGTIQEGTEAEEGLFLPEGTYQINAVASFTVAGDGERTNTSIGPVIYIKVKK